MSHVLAGGLCICHFFLPSQRGPPTVCKEILTEVASGTTLGNMGTSLSLALEELLFAPVLDMMLLRREVSSLIMCALPCRVLKTQFFDTSFPFLLTPTTFSQVTGWGSRGQVTSSALWYNLYIRPWAPPPSPRFLLYQGHLWGNGCKWQPLLACELGVFFMMNRSLAPVNLVISVGQLNTS